MTIQPPAWAGTYVGIPYADHRSDRSGCDCWGLIRLVYRERAGVVLPAYAGDYADEADTGGVAACVEAARASGTWLAVEEPILPCDVVEMLSVVRSRRGWRFTPLHVGLVAGNGWLLHTEAATGSMLVRADDPALGKRIAGYWRHRRLDVG
jgi:cell wall-associated NlpC family hydrolase